MMVTHDVKVAAKCSRILYIEDGNIKGEFSLGALEKEIEDNESIRKERERKVNSWLQEMGW